MKKIKQLLKEVISFLAHWFYQALWQLQAKKRLEHCLNAGKRPCPVIVTLTTFPGRIHIVDKTVRTILNQKTVKPDGVELYLAESQFPDKEASLPQALLELKRYGLQILWCQDTRSYKKLIPALERHPDAVLVTADDDVYYSRTWLQKLYESYLADVTCVHCHRATGFFRRPEGFEAIGGGGHYYKKPSYLNKLVGVGGVLYPPGILHPEVTDATRFMELAPTNDDLWFWFMAVNNGVRVRVVKGHRSKPVAVLGAERTEKLTTVNDHGEKKFWQQFYKLLEAYPTVEEKLRREAEESE